MLERTFAHHGWTVHGFHTAENAVDNLTRLDLDLAIIDIHLPGKSGLELVREMRRRGIHLPVIILTADQSPVARAAAESGLKIDAFLLKPVDRALLVRRAERIVELRKQGQGAARFLSDYVEELDERGDAEFAAAYAHSPVLVGLGLVTAFSSMDRLPPASQRRKKGKRPQTFPVDSVPTGRNVRPTRGKTLTDRAWPVQPKGGGPLEEVKAITVGRGPHCDLVIPEFSISETHGSLHYGDDTWWYVDHESLNGSIVDGEAVKGEGGTRVHDGSKLVLGRFQFELYMGPRFVQLVADRAAGNAMPSPVE